MKDILKFLFFIIINISLVPNDLFGQTDTIAIKTIIEELNKRNFIDLNNKDTIYVFVKDSSFVNSFCYIGGKLLNTEKNIRCGEESNFNICLKLISTNNPLKINFTLTNYSTYNGTIILKKEKNGINVQKLKYVKVDS
jgi:hypothetical protein